MVDTGANGHGIGGGIGPSRDGRNSVAMFADPEGNVIGLAKGM
jgi:hypothetical protein